MFGLNATIKKSALPYLTAVFFVAVDRYLKTLSRNLETDRIELLPQLDFTHNLNQGASFSLPINQLLLIILTALIIVGLAIAYYRSLKKGEPKWFFVWLILPASSNLYDRLAYGGVVDYFDLLDWVIFNLSDLMICLAMALLAIYALKLNHTRALNKQRQL